MNQTQTSHVFKHKLFLFSDMIEFFYHTQLRLIPWLVMNTEICVELPEDVIYTWNISVIKFHRMTSLFLWMI